MSFFELNKFDIFRYKKMIGGGRYNPTLENKI